MVLLRSFLHRDDGLVSQYLAQLEGGEYDEESVKEQNRRNKGASGGIKGGPLSANAERRNELTAEVSRTVRFTPESRFNRLTTILEEMEALQPLTALDDEIWNQLRPREIVEVRGELVLGPGVADMETVGVMGDLGSLIGAFERLPEAMQPDGFDRREAEVMREQAGAARDMADQFTGLPLPCVFSPLGSPRFRFFAELRRSDVINSVAELEGEVTVLAQIQRFIAKGKPETLGPGLVKGALNREQRRKAKAEQPFTIRLNHPAALTSVLGIYR